ncbi:PRTRC system protein E [Flavobacterium beibuense]|uniref:PRTRC system protein E n=2 Tax=Flavobacterium beibuense TaxID=657326 RepID=A0A444WEH3_9FLAO|nr:PRTRC system protein E [Flavobacterium beibuense]
MEQFLKGQETARKNAAAEKKKTEMADKPLGTPEVKPSKYESLMASVDALEGEGKFREAWMKVPQPSEFPEKAEELRGRRKSLSAKFSPDLFGGGQSNSTEVEPNTKDYVTEHTDAEGLYDEGEGQ